MITLDDFQQLDLRIGTVIEAETIEGTDKLLRLEVDLGDEWRQLVAGLAQSHEPESLTGTQVVVVTNLEPRELKGVESQGMLLAAGSKKPVLLRPESEVDTGTRIT